MTKDCLFLKTVLKTSTNRFVIKTFNTQDLACVEARVCFEYIFQYIISGVMEPDSRMTNVLSCRSWHKISVSFAMVKFQFCRVNQIKITGSSFQNSRFQRPQYYCEKNYISPALYLQTPNVECVFLLFIIIINNF